MSSAGPLRSTDVTPLPRYYQPLRHPLAFGRFPGVAGSTAYLAPLLSRRGEEGFSSGSMCPGHRAVAPTPPEGPTASAALRWSLLPSPSGCGLGLRIFALSGPPLRSLALRPGDSPAIPKMTVSMGFRSFGFPPACHPSYGASALTPAGLTPAEPISLTWTHNRTGRFPASGSRTRPHAFAHGKVFGRSLKRTRPSTSCRYSSGNRDVPRPFSLCFLRSH